jgi:4-diphosphocytidyl-2-C-methyl-D-erythritol kinase
MTGTGASVFAVFTQQEQAQKVLEMLPQGVSGFVAQGINRSPLHALCSVA